MFDRFRCTHKNRNASADLYPARIRPETILQLLTHPSLPTRSPEHSRGQRSSRSQIISASAAPGGSPNPSGSTSGAQSRAQLIIPAAAAGIAEFRDTTSIGGLQGQQAVAGQVGTGLMSFLVPRHSTFGVATAKAQIDGLQL